MRTNLFRSSRFVLLFGLLALAASGVAGVHFNREAGTARDIASKLNIGNHTAGIARIDMSLVRAYKTWRDLKNDAKYVVVATAGAQQTQVATKNLPWTTTTMNIDQVVVSKDGTKPTALLVRQLGTPANGSNNVVVDGYPVFAPGSRYLLFLTPTTIIPNVYYTVGSYQGAFSVDSANAVNSISSEAAAAGIAVNGVPLTAVISAVLGA